MIDIGRICDRVMWIDNHNIKMVEKSEDVIASYSKQLR